MHSESGGGGASGSRGYRACTRFATGWLRFYTRGLEPGAAFERMVDVELELWEHGMAVDRHSTAIGACTSLVLRTLAGVPQDLRWRRDVRAEPLVRGAQPVHQLVRRHRQRLWVPLLGGHVFDQTNGMARPEHY